MSLFLSCNVLTGERTAAFFPHVLQKCEKMCSATCGLCKILCNLCPDFPAYWSILDPYVVFS